MELLSLLISLGATGEERCVEKDDVEEILTPWLLIRCNKQINEGIAETTPDSFVLSPIYRNS